MKYWRGYLVAAIVLAFTLALEEFAKTHTQLVDMLWPYITRTYQSFMAGWSGGISICLWQLLLVFFVVLVLASLVLMVVLKWNPIQLVGWFAAVASIVYCLHIGVYGLNAHAGSIADDIHLPTVEPTLVQLEEATIYYRDKANALAAKMDRDSNGDVVFADFDTLAGKAGEGFETLVYDHSCAVFAGSTKPVKQLGWADTYTSMGITGVTFGVTGEAAVNPQIPATSLPFTMCHEMAHRMSIFNEGDANFAAFLACRYNEDLQFQYSAYFMAYRYCYNSLVEVGAGKALSRVVAGESKELRHDMDAYDEFFRSREDKKATEVATKANDTLIKTSGDSDGVKSYGQVTDLLVSWHIEKVVKPSMVEPEQKFDPYDPEQVDLTGLVNAPTTTPAQ